MVLKNDNIDYTSLPELVGVAKVLELLIEPTLNLPDNPTKAQDGEAIGEILRRILIIRENVQAATIEHVKAFLDGADEEVK